MLPRNDQPLGLALDFATEWNFDFATDSVFTNSIGNSSGIVDDEFLLLDGEPLLLLSGSNFLLLGT